MFEKYKDEIEEHINIIVNILLDTITIIVLLFCFYLIDFVTRFLGFDNEIIASILNIYVHPIMLLSIFCVSIINILHKHLPKTPADSRIELLHEDD